MHKIRGGNTREKEKSERQMEQNEREKKERKNDEKGKGGKQQPCLLEWTFALSTHLNRFVQSRLIWF